jgi:hypothetical protein
MTQMAGKIALHWAAGSETGQVRACGVKTLPTRQLWQISTLRTLSVRPSSSLSREGYSRGQAVIVSTATGRGY